MLSHSNSDYHHCRRRPPPKRSLAKMPSKHERSKSGYSILNDEHLYSEHSFYDAPMSEASYDPFRASKDPLVPGYGQPNNVTIHRTGSSSQKLHRPATALGHRTKSSLRVQALRNNSNRKSSNNSRQSSKRSNPSTRSGNSARAKGRAISRSSLTSSVWPSSPPVLGRSVNMGKRGVSFSHLKKCSMTSIITGITKDYQLTPEQRQYLQCSSDSFDRLDRVALAEDATPLTPPQVASKPATHQDLPIPKLRLRKPESPTKMIQQDVRKASSELEKTMEEAFNRSSMSESLATLNSLLAKDFSEYDTPPTSFSKREGAPVMPMTPNTKAKLRNRPLPPIPGETPNTFIQRQLQEAKDKIARKLEQDDKTNSFDNVLNGLDILMVAPSTLAQRASSAPTTRSPEHLQVPKLPNEVKIHGPDRYAPYGSVFGTYADRLSPRLNVRRAVTDNPTTTIRLVDESPIAPLNIRKKSTDGTTFRAPSGRPETQRSGLLLTQPPPPVHSFHAVQRDLLAARAESQAQTDRTSSSTVEKSEQMIKKKKSSWFRRNVEEVQPSEAPVKAPPGRLQIPEAWKGLDDRIAKAAPPSDHALVTKKSIRSISSEFPMRNRDAGKERKGFLGLFGKKAKEDKNKGA